MERDLSSGAITDLAHTSEEAQSAVSWGAILAGAVAALAFSFVLLALALGFGLQMASPWPGGRPTSDGFTPLAGSVLVAIQVISAGLGGYLAGRLRTKWTHLHGHEVHFRDTAHGLLVWAVSTVAGVILATAVVAPAASHAGAMATAAVAVQASAPQTADAAAPATPDPAVVRLEADRAKNLAAQMSLFMGVGLLLSAFIASVSAAIGGLRRDEMHGRYWGERARASGVTVTPH
jgi:MFS family permease